MLYMSASQIVRQPCYLNKRHWSTGVHKHGSGGTPRALKATWEYSPLFGNLGSTPVEHLRVPALDHANSQKTLLGQTNQYPFATDSFQQNIPVCESKANGNVHIRFQDYATLPVLVQWQASKTLE